MGGNIDTLALRVQSGWDLVQSADKWKRIKTNMEVHDDLVLHVTPDKFYVEPLCNSKELVVIDRLTQEIVLETRKVAIPHIASTKPICGILGIIRLLGGAYLIVITRKSKVGEINGQSIWKVDQTEIISFARTLLHLTEEQQADNQVFLSMVEQVLKTPYFYFSYSYDLTHTLQRLHNTMPEFLQMPLHVRADERFVWNRHLTRDLASQPELSRYVLPILHGYVSINHCSINGKPFVWALVSRRSCFRAGTRFLMRGVDSEGHVANYVETEQIVEYQGDMSSFVQTRGSIPLYWTQLPNLKYKPRPVLSVIDNHAEAFSRHFDSQVLNYGKQVLVNLIDHKGSEQKLEQAFSSMVKTFKSPLVKYEAFDFHHECRKMRWDRLSILMDRLAGDQEELGYFLRLRDGIVVKQQDGVFRTNCIDCLDRTNVVQSLLARRHLQDVLMRLDLLREGQQIELQTHFETLFKNVWADNADVVSLQYSGTGALKTDFTRTGRRTKAGALRDGVNSAVRYYKNNFADGFRQDAIDLFLGNYVIEDVENKISPFRQEKDFKIFLLPTISALAFVMWWVTVLIPTEYTTETLLYLLFWGGMVGSTAYLILHNGPEFVDWPRLVKRIKREASKKLW